MAKKINYAQIAMESMYRPADEGGPAHDRKKKILVYSRNKKGKSTFTATAPNILIADPEWGVADMKEKNPHTWPIKQWSDMENFYKFLRSNPDCPMKNCPDGKHKFEWAGIDGMTKLANMSLKHVMKIQEDRDLDRIPGLVQQRDYGKSGELMKDMMSQFNNLDMGVIYTAQERQDAPYTGDEDDEQEDAQVSYVPDLPKGVRGALTSLVDGIGRLYVIKAENSKSEMVMQRRLWLAPSIQYDTGFRSDFVLPDYLVTPTVPRLVRLLRTGSPKASA